jgi:hypothetical protein
MQFPIPQADDAAGARSEEGIPLFVEYAVGFEVRRKMPEQRPLVPRPGLAFQKGDKADSIDWLSCGECNTRYLAQGRV